MYVPEVFVAGAGGAEALEAEWTEGAALVHRHVVGQGVAAAVAPAAEVAAEAAPLAGRTQPVCRATGVATLAPAAARPAGLN